MVNFFVKSSKLYFFPSWLGLKLWSFSCRVIDDLLVKTRSDIGSLYKLREIVCQLDVIVSFAQVSSAGGYCRPSFGNELVIRSGRHPILDHFSRSALISNDTVSQSMDVSLLANFVSRCHRH